MAGSGPAMTETHGLLKVPGRSFGWPCAKAKSVKINNKSQTGKGRAG
jgi:hypothetical protein